MKKILIILPLLFSSTPFVAFAASEKEPNVSFIYSEIFIQILATLFLIWLIKKFAWKNFQEMIEHRRNSINKNIMDAKDSARNAKELEVKKIQEIEDINAKKQDIIKTTLSKAKEEEKVVVSSAKTKAKELLEKAQHEAIQEKESVKEDLSKELANISLELVKKFMFEEISEEQEQKLLKEAALKVSNE